MSLFCCPLRLSQFLGVMHVTVPIPEFSATFSHTTVTHNIITVYTTQSTTNLGRALSFRVKKTNHSMYLTAGGSGGDSVHVSSAITPSLRSENVWGQAFSDNKGYLLLLSMRFGAMKTRFFLPTNRRLIFELPTYVHVDANWHRHPSDIESLLYVNVYSCRRQLTTPSVRHWEPFICESMFMSTPTYAICQTLRVFFYMWKYVHFEASDNAICQTLVVFCMWKCVYVKAVWRLALSESESTLVSSLCE